MINRYVLLIIIIILVQFCSDDKQIRTYRIQKNKIKKESINLNFSSKSFTWDLPANWIPSKGSDMRIASFNIPFKVGSGDLSIIELSGTGGGLEANVNRWRRQLGLSPQSLQDIEKDIIIKEGSFGMYHIIDINNYRNKLGFLCAIIPVDSRTLFVKLSGNIEGIKESRDSFILFSSSISLKKQ